MTEHDDTSDPEVFKADICRERHRAARDEWLRTMWRVEQPRLPGADRASQSQSQRSSANVSTAANQYTIQTVRPDARRPAVSNRQSSALGTGSPRSATTSTQRPSPVGRRHGGGVEPSGPGSGASVQERIEWAAAAARRELALTDPAAFRALNRAPTNGTGSTSEHYRCDARCRR